MLRLRRAPPQHLQHPPRSARLGTLGQLQRIGDQGECVRLGRCRGHAALEESHRISDVVHLQQQWRRYELHFMTPTLFSSSATITYAVIGSPLVPAPPCISL